MTAGAAVLRPGVMPRIAIGVGSGLLVLLLLITAPLALLSGASESGSDGPRTPPNGIPSGFVAIYRESARVFGLNWLLLAAVHKQETRFSTDATTYHGLNSAGCCAGPFQFNLTNGPPSTWDTYRGAFRRGRRPADYPHRQTPHPSVYDDFDAGMAAGALLKANGADATLGPATYKAVRDYNGVGPEAEAYAQAVLQQARTWQAEGDPINAPERPAAPGGGQMAWPVRGPVVSPFGQRWGRLHAGIDIAASTGTRILAAATGRVSIRGPVSGYGLYTCLEHQPPLSTCYAHQSRLGPTPIGGVITRGALVGYVGCTGHCFGPHLHFEVRKNGHPIDPQPYLGGTP